MKLLDTKYYMEMLDENGGLIDAMETRDENEYENFLYTVFDDMNVAKVEVTRSDYYAGCYVEISVETIAA